MDHPRPSSFSPLTRHLIAVLAPAVAFVLTLRLESVMAHNPFLFFIVAVVAGAWVGGLGPGLLSSVLSTILSSYFLPPAHAFYVAGLEEYIRLGVFLFVACVINLSFFLRQRAVESLREREREEQIIFDSVPAMIWYKDKENRILRANRRAAESMGMTKQELEGKSTYALYPDEAARYHQDDLEVINSGKPQIGIIEPYQGQSGEKRWVQTDKILYRDDRGGILGVIVFAVDITDRKLAEEAIRKSHADLERLVQERTQSLVHANEALRTQIQERLQTEAALRESEGRLRSLIEAMPQQVWTARPDGALDYVSQRVVEYFGRPFEEMIGWGWEQVLHPDDLPECRKRWLHALETGEPYVIEFRLKRASDESYRWHLGRALPLRDQTGRIIKWFGTNTDITERKQEEKVLRNSEERYRVLYESNPTMYFTLNPWGTVLSVNNFGAHELGYPPHELIGKSVWTVIYEEDRQVVAQHIEECVQSPGRLAKWEFRKVRKDGSLLWVKEVGCALRDPQGDLMILIVCDDITARKQAETALQRAYEELEWRVSERTADLARSRGQLRALAAHLESVREEERTTIARDIHDELGQALTALNMDLAWIRNQLPQSSPMHPLREKASAMAGLITQTISSVRRIATELRPGVLDQLGLAAAMEWQATAFQKRSGVACRLVLPDGEIELNAQQSTALFRMLQEALTNVARHADATSVTITLGKADAEVRLTVEDNGKGHVEEIPSATRSLGILGMRERALALGGAVRIQGIPGQGTTVTVSLPLNGGSHDVEKMSPSHRG